MKPELGYACRLTQPTPLNDTLEMVVNSLPLALLLGVVVSALVIEVLLSLRNGFPDALKNRTRLSHQEFHKQYFSRTGITENDTCHVLQCLRRAFGKESECFRPADNIAEIYPDIDMADLYFVIGIPIPTREGKNVSAGLGSESPPLTVRQLIDEYAHHRLRA
ncbi:hypothetical protein [Rubinisphaera sp. JC750]|uniref:hypothetical protein n=1 Tax=Rubinisphaera sp. JC750 TaxID=2898658 RepID=UPI001F29D88E|nr:hypothetical protein [Rubinisphaera sp. JC750]